MITINTHKSYFKKKNNQSKDNKMYTKKFLITSLFKPKSTNMDLEKKKFLNERYISKSKQKPTIYYKLYVTSSFITILLLKFNYFFNHIR